MNVFIYMDKCGLFVCEWCVMAWAVYCFNLGQIPAPLVYYIPVSSIHKQKTITAIAHMNRFILFERKNF